MTELERCKGAGCAGFATLATPTGTTYNDTNLDAATIYSYRVRAVDTAGNLIGYSNVASDTTLTAAPAIELVAAYAFNEGTGSIVADASGHDNVGTISGTAWTTSGKFESALVFNGTSAEVTVPNSASLGLTTAMTLEAWVFPTVTPTGWRAVVAKNVGGYYLSASSDSNDRPAIGGIWDTGTQNLVAPLALVANVWTHLAATYDGVTLRLYENGMEVASHPRAGLLVPTTGTLQIGANSFGQFFAGRIDEVRIYKGALSAAEIQTDMITSITPDTSAPTTPAVLTATGASGTQLNLAWIDSTDDVGIFNYRVERCTGTPCVFVEVATRSGTTYSDTAGLAANTMYQYRVRAVDATGNLSSYSNIASASTLAPDTVSLTAVAVDSTQINLALNASAAQAYDQSLGQGVEVGNVVSYTMPGLDSGRRYYFAATAIDTSNNESDFSNEVFKDIP